MPSRKCGLLCGSASPLLCPAYLVGPHLPARRRRCRYVRSEASRYGRARTRPFHVACMATGLKILEFLRGNSFELSSRKWSRNRGWSSAGGDRCHGGGNCGGLGLPEAGEHASEGDVRHDVVFRCSYGGASDTGVDVSHEVNQRGSTSCGAMNSGTLQGLPQMGHSFSNLVWSLSVDDE